MTKVKNCEKKITKLENEKKKNHKNVKTNPKTKHSFRCARN